MMRRKVIKQGNNSYTITLPIKWVREHHLAEGKEISISETDGKLYLTTERTPEAKSTTIIIKENHPLGIRFLLQQVYRQHYDTIIVRYSSQEIYHTIREVAERYFLGLEIVDKSKNFCTLAVVVEGSEEKFHLFMRKMFLLIRDSLTELISGHFSSIHHHYFKLYAYQNYCKRYIYSKKRELSSYDYYSLLSYLLNIQADMKKLAESLQQHNEKNLWNTTTWRTLLAILSDIENNFYLKRTPPLMKISEDIQKMILHLQQNIPPKKTLIFWHYQLEIARLLYGALSPLQGIVLYKSDRTS
jgi:antitoxin component of MazEF toxin-antitoxin module